MPVYKNNQRGYALLEIMLAFSIGMVIMVGMVSLGISTVRAVTENRLYAEAGKIAQREVDRLKLLRDTNVWGGTNGFYDKIDGCAASCFIRATDMTVQSGSSTETFSVGGPDSIRYWFVVVTQPYGIDYTVNTLWTVGTKTKTYTIQGSLTNWKEL